MESNEITVQIRSSKEKLYWEFDKFDIKVNKNASVENLRELVY